MQLGRRHDKDDSFGRFLKRLEQCIERRFGKLVDLVDDKDLVTVACRVKVNALDDRLADVVDAGVRGGVDLENVDRAALGYLETRRAHRVDRSGARREVWPGGLMAIERLGKQTGGSGLADPSCSREKVCVMQTVVFDRIAQRVRNDLLTGDLFECLRPPFTGDYLIRHLCEL